MSAFGDKGFGSEPIAGAWHPHQEVIPAVGKTVTLTALFPPLSATVSEDLAMVDGEVDQMIGNTSIADVATFTATVTEGITALLAETFSILDSTTTTATQGNTLSETLTVGDAVLAALTLILTEGITLTAVQTDGQTIAQSLADSLIASGTVDTQLEADNVLAATFSILDAAQMAFHFDVTDGITVGDTVAPSVLVAIQMTAQALVSDSNTAYILADESFTEGLTISDAVSSLLQATNTIEETLAFGFTFALGDDRYMGIATNTDGAITNYQNFPFNSLTECDGRYFGATDTGIYELVGDDDDGTEIDAWIRTGLIDFGTSQERRIPAVYMGYRSDGTVVLKAVVTQDGTKKEYWYELTEQTAGAFRNGRIKLGRGLKSRYWQFEIHNKDGADFALGDIEFLPVQITRRI